MKYIILRIDSILSLNSKYNLFCFLFEKKLIIKKSEFKCMYAHINIFLFKDTYFFIINKEFYYTIEKQNDQNSQNQIPRLIQK